MLAILATHPVQYQVPLWRELARRLPGGVEVWYLSDRGHRVAMDREFGQPIAWDIEMLGGYEHRMVAPASGAALRRLVRHGGCTALLINGWFPRAYWTAAALAHRAGIPVMLRGETNDLRRVSPIKEAVRRPALRWLFRRVAWFLAIGAANRRFYGGRGVPAERLGWSPYCVDNVRFAESAAVLRPHRPEIRVRWGIPIDARCFLYCGKLIPKKRVGDVLSAFDRVLAHLVESGGAPVHLLVAGDGEQRGVLESVAAVLRRPDGTPAVTFTGFRNQTEIPEAYVAADCLVLPSDARETWGLVVNEAMACGLPALVSDQVGCGEDLIGPGMTGDVFPMGDVSRLAALMEAWAERAALPDVRDAVLERISAYSVQRAADGIVSGLDRLARERAQSHPATA